MTALSVCELKRCKHDSPSLYTDSSNGFGCINVKGSSTETSLKNRSRSWKHQRTTAASLNTPLAARRSGDLCKSQCVLCYSVNSSIIGRLPCRQISQEPEINKHWRASVFLLVSNDELINCQRAAEDLLPSDPSWSPFIPLTQQIYHQMSQDESHLFISWSVSVETGFFKNSNTVEGNHHIHCV